MDLNLLLIYAIIVTEFNNTINLNLEVDFMDKLYRMAKGHTDRFPDGNEPFQIIARILEECGEVASEVNHFERSGIKIQKLGEPSLHHMADEIKQAINALIQLVQYYGIESELEQSIDKSLDIIKNEN